jgi:hypothetical protein
MALYEHTITIYDRETILSGAPAGGFPPSVVFCDTEGVCLFDEAPNPYVTAIIELLNEMGRDSWNLVQLIPREQDIICIWRRELVA